jgi:hypothetical protein
MCEVAHIGIIFDEMREVIEDLWPELRTSFRRRGHEAELIPGRQDGRSARPRAA